MIETYSAYIHTGIERENIEMDIVYGFDDGTYFDALDEELHDELVYMEPGETLVLVVRRNT